MSTSASRSTKLQLSSTGKPRMEPNRHDFSMRPTWPCLPTCKAPGPGSTATEIFPPRPARSGSSWHARHARCCYLARPPSQNRRAQMKSLALLVLLAACPTTADAEPRKMSQHPRSGLLAEIMFSEGSTRLPDASGSQLGQIAAWAYDNFDGLVVVDGHADASGPAANNVRLSMRRARL